MKKDLTFIVIIIYLVVYSVSAFAYIQKTYVSKDVFELVLSKLDKIENLLIKQIERDEK